MVQNAACAAGTGEVTRIQIIAKSMAAIFQILFIHNFFIRRMVSSRLGKALASYAASTWLVF